MSINETLDAVLWHQLNQLTEIVGVFIIVDASSLVSRARVVHPDTYGPLCSIDSQVMTSRTSVSPQARKRLR